HAAAHQGHRRLGLLAVTELLEFLVESLVEDPSAVVVEELEEDGDLVYEITVAEDDLGRVIGKGGRVANAIRTIAKAAAVRLDRRVIVDILD
ncbi:MAG TPA: KH domain-containing protein, partial [Solirubrobacterales bacterium]|nr:KH domain-containing protein [Solirubrobacterales bacterium]